VPLSTYVPPLYASAFGFSLGTVGLIFLLARLWDAVIDPAIGLLSDRTRSRWGRRRPWIAAGAAIFALGAVPVFLPPAWFGPLALSAALFVLYLGYSMMATPLAAWMGELSGAYHERTRITTYAQALTCVALLLALVLPSLLVTRLAGQPRLELAAMGAMVFALLALTLPLGIRALPEPPPLLARRIGAGVAHPAPGFRRRHAAARPGVQRRRAPGAGRAHRAVRVLHQPLHGPSRLGARPVPAAICVRHLCLPAVAGDRPPRGQGARGRGGELTQVAINLGLLALAPGSVALLLALTVAQGLAQGSGNLMLRSIVADVADYHRLRTGEDRIGLFFSVFSLSDKAGVALAIGIALPLAAWIGFDPRGSNPAPVLEHLKWLFALGPALGHIISAAVIHGFPLDERRHGDIRRQLAARDAAGLVSDASRDRWLAEANRQGD
jgi:Na+/melibiose symporter-like transporter